MIESFISDVCEILNINIPSVSYDTSNFSTDTMMAQCDPSRDTIHIKRYNKPNPEQFFAIAHELRHIWQIKTNERLYFSNYKPVHLHDSVEEYNLQIAELDANAFATLIMIEFFHIKPLFENFSDSIKDKIYEQVSLILAELTE